MNIKYGEELTLLNYSEILSTKITEFINKLKILKLIDGVNAQKESNFNYSNF